MAVTAPELTTHPAPVLTQQPPPPPPAHVPSHDSGCAEALYERDIEKHLRLMELAPGRLPSPDYMNPERTGVTRHTRAVLVGWLVSAAQSFDISSGTLHLAVACLDRFLSATAGVSVHSRLGLMPAVCAALFVATKYEEGCAPPADWLVYETPCDGLPFDEGFDGCTKSELLAAEVVVLEALGHDLSAPTAHTFLELFLERLRVQNCHGDDGDVSAFLACYLAELSLLDYGMLRFRPSVVAASAMLVARLSSAARRPREHPWEPALEAATGYTAAELKECALALHRLHLHRHSGGIALGPGYEDINHKYCQVEFNKVSDLVPLADLFGAMEIID